MQRKKGGNTAALGGTRGDANFKKRSLGKKPELLKCSLGIKAELLLFTNNKLVSQSSD